MKSFQYSKAYDLLSDHHLCQVAPKLQSRSHIFLDNLKFELLNISLRTKFRKKIVIFFYDKLEIPSENIYRKI